MANRNRHKDKHKNLINKPVQEVLHQLVPGQRKFLIRLGQGKSQEEGTLVQRTQNVRFRRFPIAWGVPMDELGYSYWMIHLLQQPIMPWDPIITCLNTYLPEARSYIHQSFVNECKTSKFLVMLDSDVIPPANAITKCLDRKLPLVGGWYPKKSDDPKERKPVVYNFSHLDENGTAKWNIREKPGEGLEEVDGAGAGFWVMRRDVAEAIGERPYDMLRCGEDLEMCLKVKEAGYNIYIDWSLKAEHRGVFSI